MADLVDEVLRLTEQLETKKLEAIEELLKQRAAAVQEFDEKLAKLGYKGVRTTSTEASGKERKKRGPMSEEHKQKIAESRARKKAEKAGDATGAAKEPRLVKKDAKGGS